MSEIQVDETVYQGRPGNWAEREKKEQRVYEVLEELQIEFTRVDHEAAMTIEACEKIDALLGTPMCKNLFLCNRQKTEFYLLLMPGNKSFKTKDFSAQIQTARLSFADGAFMEEFLDITPGSVSVLGLMNDKDCRVKLYLDREIAEAEYLGCHPCINTSSLCIKTKDVLEKFLPYTKHTYGIVELE